MIEFKGWVCSGSSDRYAGYDRITGLICWLLIALVSLYTNIVGLDTEIVVLLGFSCFALFCYRSLAGRLVPSIQLKGALDLSCLLVFAFTVCWFTGNLASPFLCVLYLVLMISSLALGRRVTSLLAAASVAACLALAVDQWPLHPTLQGTIIALIPFVLTAWLSTLLSGASERALAEVERLSLTDDLTELNNMRSFDNLAQQQEKLSRRYRKPYAICMLDADNLKEINDRHGHLAGTELIKWTARIISQNTRECDIAARFGGDEFIIMFEGHDKDQIRPAVERIVRVMAATPFTFDGQPVVSTLSAGIASYPADGLDLRSVIMKADEAMYHSKRVGKNRVTISQDEAVRKGQDEVVRKGKGALQVGGEQLGGGVPELHRKSTAVHLGEGDLAGRGQGNAASLFKDSGKG